VLCGLSQSPYSVSEETLNFSSNHARISQYYKDLWGSVAHPHTKNAGRNWYIENLAIHRWLGSKRDRTVQYRLIQEAFVGNTKVCKQDRKCKIMDAGCGMGSAMLYFGKLGWDVEGYTIAKNQYNYIIAHFPELTVFLSSYNQIPDKIKYSSIYAIESLWHSNWRQTLEVWANHLEYGGRVAVIDDFAVNQSSATSDSDIQEYVKGWMLKAITTVDKLCEFATQNLRLRCISRRDLTEEFNVNKNNYNNLLPKWKNSWRHQGFKGSYFRQKSSIRGLLKYSLVCLEKL